MDLRHVWTIRFRRRRLWLILVIRNYFRDDYRRFDYFLFPEFSELINDDTVWINVRFATVYHLMNTCYYAMWWYMSLYMMLILMLLINASDLWMHDFDDDELLVMFCIMQIWCDDIFILMWINYSDVGFMPILTSDDGVFVLCYFIVESHALHKRRGLSCQAMMAFMPSDDGFYAERR